MKPTFVLTTFGLSASLLAPLAADASTYTVTSPRGEVIVGMVDHDGSGPAAWLCDAGAGGDIRDGVADWFSLGTAAGLSSDGEVIGSAGNDQLRMVTSTLILDTWASDCVGTWSPLEYNGHYFDLYGGDGDDTLYGGLGDTYLLGGDGDDILVVSSPIGRAYGQAGNDRLTGPGAAQGYWLDGGPGDDCIEAAGGTWASLACGADTDRYYDPDASSLPFPADCETRIHVLCKEADSGVESCNGVDDDGDGLVDEGCPCTPNGTCSGALECVTSLNPSEAPSCHPACTNFCDASCASRPDVLRVADLGALPGDGLDDYASLQALAAAASGRAPTDARMHVVFSPGTYEIQQYIDLCGRKSCLHAGEPGRGNSVDHIRYTGAHNVDFHGCGAQIVSSPPPQQVIDYSDEGLDRTWYSTVGPFYISASTGFTIDDFDLDGSVNHFLPRDSNVETDSNGILTSACSDYILRNLEVHHYSRDGIGIGVQSPDSETVVPLVQFDPNGQYDCPGFARSQCDVVVAAQDRNALIDNVFVHHNARNNLSVFFVDGLLARYSYFVDGGCTGDAAPGGYFADEPCADNPVYRGYNPKAGVDVEPDFSPRPKFKDDTGYASEATTKNVVFEGCSFFGNRGAQIVVSGATDGTDDILVSDSSVIRRIGSSVQAVMSRALDFEIANSLLALGDGRILLRDRRDCASRPTGFRMQGSVLRSTWRQAINAVLTSTTTADCADGLDSTAELDDNDMYFDGASIRSPTFIYTWGPGVTLSNNRVHIEATAHLRVADPTAPATVYVAKIMGGRSMNNVFDVHDPGGVLPAGAKFVTTYFHPMPEVVDDFYPMPGAFIPQAVAAGAVGWCSYDPSAKCVNHTP
ncbi:MAG: hypothetical protein KC933_26390 [Myxococcales bacterium]|nr:hypothetical protein [Myxococcales bacterium]